MNTVNLNKGDIYLKSTITEILNNGYKDINPRPKYSDGVPAHTLSVNHMTYKYDLSKGEFPFITLRPLAVKNSIKEIFWIYQDQTNDLDTLKNKYNIHWWDEWESKDYPGTIGQRYGATVKKHKLMDKLLDGLKKDPYGRRHIMSLWQEEDFNETDGLMPCAFQTIWNVRNSIDGKEYLDMCLIQRSSDWMTAGHINAMQYCALLMMVAKHCGYVPGVFTHFIANVQIYDRHIDAAKEILNRSIVECNPKLVLDCETTDFYSMKPDDFKIVGYPREEIKELNPQVNLDIGI